MWEMHQSKENLAKHMEFVYRVSLQWQLNTIFEHGGTSQIWAAAATTLFFF